MKRLIAALCCLGILALCGCGGRLAEARTLPDVRILDEVMTVSEETSITPAPVPERTAKPVSIPKATEKPSPSPSPSPEPLPTAAPTPGPTLDPALCAYVGSRNSEVYHLAGCSQAARIRAENLIGWNTAAEAEAAGRTPCKACLSDGPEKTPAPTAAPKPSAEPKPSATPAPTASPRPTETVIPIVTPEPTAEPEPTERAVSGEYAYVGSRNAEVYHFAGCSQAARIRAENLIGWDTAAEAEAAGRTPCKVCLPGKAEETPEPTETVVPVATPEPTEQAAPGEYAYVGSRNSDKYHLPSCRHAKNIDEENLLGWASREEAEAAGYSACKVCRP